MNPAALVHLLIASRYETLALFSFLEGSLVCLIAGFLARLSYFSIVPAFGIIIAGDLLPNIIFFFLGRWGRGSRFVRSGLARLHVSENHFKMIEKFWVTHTWNTMVLSKLAWSMGMPFFMSAGMTTLSFAKYISVMFVTAVVQYGIIFFIGYGIGHSYAMLSTYHNALDIFGIACSAVIVIVLLVVVPKYAKRELLR